MKKSQINQFIIYFIVLGITWLGATEIKSDSTLNPTKLGPKTISIKTSKYEAIYHVSIQKGSDKAGNGSKQKPWQTINHTLRTISNLDENGKSAVLVAEGIYNQGTILMIEDTELFGGFSAENWARDIVKYPSILDGCGVRRVVVGANNARIDGFTIRHGLSRSHGGGILCDNISPIISNNCIMDNFVLEPEDFNHYRIHQEGNIGGGVACLYDAVPVIRNNVFYRNRTSVGMGGALAFYGWVRHKGGPQMEVKNNRLMGGLRALVENNVIINNISGVNDIYRTRSSSGAGIACAYEARPIIRNNLLVLNQAKGNSDAGGIYCEYFSDPDVIGNWILGNIGDDDGGGFYTMKLGLPFLKGNIFAGNWTTGGGIGGVRLSKEGRARIEDNIIVQNPGGGVMSVDAYMELDNNIIADNSLGYGLSYVNHFNYFKPSLISNNIFQNNENGSLIIRNESVNNPIIEKNFIQGGFKGEKNSSQIPLQRNDGLKAYILSAKFNQNDFTTKVILKKPLKTDLQLEGRIIRINEHWSIIKAIQSDNIIIWGDIALGVNRDHIIEIIPDYVRE